MALTVHQGGATPTPSATGEAGEAEAMLRIANAIAAELPAITSPHWHDALAGIRGRLSETAARRASGPSLGGAA